MAVKLIILVLLVFKGNNSGVCYVFASGQNKVKYGSHRKNSE